METLKKFDIHIHTDMWDGREVPRYDGSRFATPDQLRGMYARLGIDRGLLLPAVSPENSFAFQANEQAAIVAAENPDLFVWACNIDPRMAYNSPKNDLGHFLRYYKDMGAKGMGELTPNIPADCELLDNLFRACAENDLPVTIHLAPETVRYGCYGIQDSLGLPRLERVLKKYPSLKIFGHSTMFWSQISGNVTDAILQTYPSGPVVPGGPLVRLMRENPNLYGDMSAGSGGNAFMRDPDFGCAFIEEFQDRLLFGTDICDVRNDMRLSFWLDEMAGAGRISETAYRKICRENAVRLLGLDG